MTDFIEVYDQALETDLCEQLMARFLASDARRPGQTGMGLDRGMKDSTDINLTRAPDWADLHQRLMASVARHLVLYMRKYAYLLIGAIATGRRDPQSGKQTTFTEADLTEATAGQLMQRLYRPGDLIAQQYQQGVGGYHHFHSEIYPRPGDPHCEVLHRVLLFMYYLNTVDEGGETEFFYQQRKIKPVQGRMVIAPGGFTHTHKGHVPQSGDKLIVTSWVLFNRAEQIYSPGNRAANQAT